MKQFDISLHGMTKLIFESLQQMLDEPGHNSQIIDCRLLQKLEEQLRQRMVVREDGSSRLVIDLVLTRSMDEVRQLLSYDIDMQLAALPALEGRSFSPHMVN